MEEQISGCQSAIIVEMKAEDVIWMVETLEGAGIDVWIHGGWGVDALLGEQTRPHSDVDINVQLADVPRMLELLAADGFGVVHGELHSNFVIKDATGRSIDVHPVRFDENGDGIYRMENGHDWAFPAAGFAGRGAIAGRPVRCLTPEVEMLCHAEGYEPDEDDFRDMYALNQKFGVELPPHYRKWRPE